MRHSAGATFACEPSLAGFLVLGGLRTAAAGGSNLGTLD
jgi:hypothetical protein